MGVNEKWPGYKPDINTRYKHVCIICIKGLTFCFSSKLYHVLVFCYAGTSVVGPTNSPCVCVPQETRVDDHLQRASGRMSTLAPSHCTPHDEGECRGHAFTHNAVPLSVIRQNLVYYSCQPLHWNNLRLRWHHQGMPFVTLCLRPFFKKHTYIICRHAQSKSTQGRRYVRFVWGKAPHSRLLVNAILIHADWEIYFLSALRSHWVRSVSFFLCSYNSLKSLKRFSVLFKKALHCVHRWIAWCAWSTEGVTLKWDTLVEHQRRERVCL